MPERTPAGDSRPPRTLWEEGQHPGRLVVRAAVVALVVATAADLVVGNRLGLIFDVFLVGVCVGAALWVRPRDFFTVGVLPPLLLLAFVLVLTFADRAAIARPHDGAVQAIVTGLAHHGVALVIAYALTLAVLGLRQVALRHNGALRGQRPPTVGEVR